MKRDRRLPGLFSRMGQIFGVLVFAMLLTSETIGVFAQSDSNSGTSGTEPTAQADSTVDIDQIDFSQTPLIFMPAPRPELFVACVDNPYFPLIPGTVYQYEERTPDGLETVTVTVLKETREVMGIEATVVRDTVEIDGELIEDTWDWYAQDDRGNVWYLGEDTREYENGEIVSTAGSWEAGVDGAMPGIIMLGDPRAGDIYFQEYYSGEAEDQGAVLSLSESASVPYGDFTSTLMTADYNPLDEELEHKFYAAGVGLVKELVVDGSGGAELVDINHDNSQTDPDRACGENGGVSSVGDEG